MEADAGVRAVRKFILAQDPELKAYEGEQKSEGSVVAQTDSRLARGSCTTARPSPRLRRKRPATEMPNTPCAREFSVHTAPGMCGAAARTHDGQPGGNHVPKFVTNAPGVH